jgi:hypothetical protein
MVVQSGSDKDFIRQDEQDEREEERKMATWKKDVLGLARLIQRAVLVSTQGTLSFQKALVCPFAV